MEVGRHDRGCTDQKKENSIGENRCNPINETSLGSKEYEDQK